MKIIIPQSFFDEIVSLQMQSNKVVEVSLPSNCMNFRGPFGTYQVCSQPDEDYTEEKVETVRRYKDG